MIYPYKLHGRNSHPPKGAEVLTVPRSPSRIRTAIRLYQGKFESTCSSFIVFPLRYDVPYMLASMLPSSISASWRLSCRGPWPRDADGMGYLRRLRNVSQKPQCHSVGRDFRQGQLSVSCSVIQFLSVHRSWLDLSLFNFF